jgi:hypothetical protein
MGEAKRRQANPDQDSSHKDRIVNWLPLTKTQAQQFVQLTTKGAWFGIGAMALLWITVRLIGPAAGWWTTQ